MNRNFLIAGAVLLALAEFGQVIAYQFFSRGVSSPDRGAIFLLSVIAVYLLVQTRPKMPSQKGVGPKQKAPITKNEG